MDRINFIGIGQPRSGTTWISNCLEEHPDVLFSSKKTVKEINFFNSLPPYINYHKGIQWYLNQFPDYQEGKIRGEFSTSYMCDPDAYKNIQKHFPNVKILVILRNPVDFLFSLYMWCKQSVLYHDLPDTITNLIEDQKYYPQFVDKGSYYKYLKEYYDCFPKGNIHVMIYEDIIIQPENLVKNLYSFLGIDATYIPSVLNKKVNTSIKTRFNSIHNIICKISDYFKQNYPKFHHFYYNRRLFQVLYFYFMYKRSNYNPLNDDTRKIIYQLYRDDIIQLESLIQRDLSIWKI